MTQGDLERLAGVREGDLLAGKYRVERVLGAGGMGAVVAAYHMQLETKVALKFLLPAMLANEEAVTRFAREARAAVKITNEHVARVLDVGTLESGAPYIVMEYLDGTDLAGWLRQRGPLPIEEAIDFVLQAGEALAEAHALGIVHRDLKPANLFCIRSADGRPTIKVLDFGISKVTNLSASASNLVKTQTATLMGSPFYMSPEQMEATHAVDARTDIWALGVILFELLTGKVPFYGETVPEVSLKIGLRAPPPLRDFRPDAPETLQAVVFRCLEKNRERRYRNMAELALALLPFGPKRAKASVEKITAIIQGGGLSATALSPSSEPTSQPPSSETMAPLGRTARGTNGGRTALGLFVAVGVMALVGGVVGIRRHSPALQTTDSGLGASPHATLLDAAGETGPSDAASPETCASHSTQCTGPVPATCDAGHWVEGAVTAGQCGAACTPGASRARCPSIAAIQTCGSNGQWEEPVLCDRWSTCHDGTCIRDDPHPPKHDAGPSPTTTATAIGGTPPRPNCDPDYTYDDQGRKHFKPECFSNPSR